MTYSRVLLLAAVFYCVAARAQQSEQCAGLNRLNLSGVEITKAEAIAAGTTVPPPYPGAHTQLLSRLRDGQEAPLQESRGHP